LLVKLPVSDYCQFLSVSSTLFSHRVSEWRVKQYSRIIVLFGSAFGCVAINFWLITTGHYRWPLVVLVACLVGTPLVMRKLPPITIDPEQIRTRQLKAASAARRMGWIYIVGLILGTVNLFSGGRHEFPWWGIVLLLGWSGFLIWSSFWRARRFKEASAASQAVQSKAPKE
jgi:hypothetical protein